MKRYASFVCAAALVFSFLITPELAHAANMTVDLKFRYPDEGKTAIASILLGGYADFIEENGGNFSPDNETPFSKGVNSGTQPNPDMTKINVDPALNRISVDKDFRRSMVLDSNDVGIATLSIKGNYIALLRDGTAREFEPTWGQGGTSYTMNADVAVSGVENTISIKALANETQGTIPYFEMVEGSDKGVFEGYDVVTVDASTAETQDSGKTTANALTKHKLVVTFSRSNPTAADKRTLDNVKFTINMNQVHPVYKTTNGVVDRDQNGDPIISSWNNYISKNTTVQLNLEGPTSNELVLNVLTPEAAVQAIAKEIAQEGTKQEDGKGNAKPGKYIQLGDGDEGQYITKNFTMTSKVNRYGTDFTIDWHWEPSSETPGYVNTIRTSEGTKNYTADVTRETFDVRGNLFATVHYNKVSDTSSTAKWISDAIPVRVFGTGEPASVNEESLTIGTSVTDLQSAPLRRTLDMDVYDGTVDNYAKPLNPREYVVRLNMGAGNASSRYAKVELVSGDGEIVKLGVNNNKGVNYTDVEIGAEIDNPKKDSPSENGTAYLRVVAEKPGTARLKIVFYVLDNKGDVVPASVQPDPITITVADTSPSDDSSLKELVVKDQNGKQLDFAFSPLTLQYDLSVPHSTESITVKPTRTPEGSTLANKQLDLTIAYTDENGVEQAVSSKLESGRPSDFIKLTENIITTVSVTVTAENPNLTSTYVIKVMREPPSGDSKLQTLEMLETKNLTNVLTDFTPEQTEYSIHVPYSTKMLRVKALARSTFVSKIMYSPELDYKAVPFIGTKDYLKLNYSSTDPSQSVTKLQVTVVPENEQPADMTVYTVNIERDDPSTDALLASLSVTDSAKNALSYTPTFEAANLVYDLEIPYSTSKIKVQAAPVSEYATMKLVVNGQESGELAVGAPSASVDIPAMTSDKPYYEVTVLVTAEDESTTKSYTIRVARAEPNTDSSLTSLTAADQNAAAIDLGFYADVLLYDVSVGYEVEKVTLTPTAADVNVHSITVNGRTVKSGSPSSSIKLEYPGKTQIDVAVTAEDGKTQRVYTVFITRQPPDSDARLKDLTIANTEKFKPVFVSNKTDYSASVVKDAKTVAVTATTNKPYSTLMINGKKATSATPTDPIDIIEPNQDIEIVVTAQDGKTTMTYIVHITNENLIDKSSNADLKSLKINYGAMTPDFKPAVVSYEVAATEETYSVDILPRPADSMAKVEVFSGSKEIGDENGNYSSAIKDGANTFKILVTAPDESKTKEYVVSVYRDEEDKMKTLKPTTAEDIDFESADPILVDITKYTRVAADVFTEMKNYPEKTIIFQGNDYSLQFKGSDIGKVVPSTDIFDFAMSFTSPEENLIDKRIDAFKGNDDYRSKDIVFAYFTHHGALPAPAVFNLSLGTRYGDETLFWHYYNTERDRIDYYGEVDTSSKGTFAVELDHMSTYVITRRHRIAGSENKAGDDSASPKLSAEIEKEKLNPNTGKQEGQP